MIDGSVSEDGIPFITLMIDGKPHRACIDTGFNGDLELPDSMRVAVRARFIGEVSSALAGGQTVEEQAYLVDFPFDGRIMHATATFVNGTEILIGTRLIRAYKLEVKFASNHVALERE